MDENNFNHTESYDIILFDGVCNLCNHAVTFIIDRDYLQTFKFASLQSTIGQRILKQLGLPQDSMKSLVLVRKNQAYMKSTAALKIAYKLDGLWPSVYIFIILPPPLRNFFYDIIAKYRYKMFGKSESCRYPSDELKSRFIDL